jgi:GDSL-like Lipase/Acylhydrolase family
MGGAGRVFLTGPDARRIVLPAPGGWRRMGGSVDAQPSTTGALVLSSVFNHNPLTTPAAAAGRRHSPDRPDPVYIKAALTAGHRELSFRVVPKANGHVGQDVSPALRVGGGSGKPLSRKAVTPFAVDPSTVPWDPDRGCAVPRNDPAKQVFQATGQQVEWAADLAVKGALTVTRPANFRGSGMPVSWSPQGLFPLHALSGGGAVPAQVLLGVLAQESNTMQASPHAVDGITGNFNQGGFYGDLSSWSTVDCGYGAGQVTTGMSVAEGTSVYTANQQLAIATDYASNIAASLNALIGKWNALRAANIIANNGDPQYVQNWWFALWAYNSGIQPRSADFGNTTGCTPSPSCTDGAGNWGLGWSNNPANPNYPVDRHIFHTKDEDTKTPNLWPYEELVMGWAQTPVARYNYTDGNWQWAYVPENSPTSATSPMPKHDAFCATTANHCMPSGATDLNGQPGAGLCQLSNLHCWWHQSITWTDCATACATEAIEYSPGSAEPGYTSIYPADCSLSGLPSGTVIVDDVTTPSVAPCTKTWTDQGSFSLHFVPSSSPSCTSNCIIYPGKIDFHQLGVGFGGHIWFTHLVDVPQVVGTWTPPSTMAGWTRIKVHVPDNGATTEMADYQISLGNGQTRHRLVNQDWWKNTWVDLGTFNLSGGASVSLSNGNSHVMWTDGRDVAYDAVAFIPSTQPYSRYVALGDSYSAGEGLGPYEPDGDQYNDGTPDSCHRSGQAYSYQVKLPGHGASIAADEAANRADFHFLACSGAETINLTDGSVDTANTWNTDWGSTNDYHSGEPYQIDASGWLDADTTLVTLSIGGNDARFADILRGCIVAKANCLADGYQLTRGNGRIDPESLATYEPKVIAALRSHLASTYQAIHRQAPNARVVVVGYPQLFEPNPPLGCNLLWDNQQLWMNQMADLLNQTIADAVADTRALYPAMSITVINPTSGFLNHRVCDSDNWIYPILSPSQNGSDGTGFQVPGSGSFHPTAAGQTEYATLINATL